MLVGDGIIFRLIKCTRFDAVLVNEARKHHAWNGRTVGCRAMQYQRMREEDIAGLTSHHNDAQLSSVDSCAGVHEPPDPIGVFIA